MSNDIEMYKDLIARQVRRGEVSSSCWGKWQKSYAWPNEDEKEILKLIDFKRIKRVLTVLSSGDYLYSLISKGIINVDTFDISPITEYYALGLKRSAIETIPDCGELKRYLGNLIYSDNARYVSREIEKLFPFMIAKYQLFWSEMIKFNYDLQKRKGRQLPLLCLLLNTDKCFPNRCSYLSSQKDYDRLRIYLKGLIIKHYNINILDVRKPLEPGVLYNLIIMSNILDYLCEKKSLSSNKYTTYADFKEVEKRLFNLLVDEGMIVNTITGSNSALFSQSRVHVSQLQSNERLYDISNSRSYNHDRCLILTKTKKK